jgi:hypothetical protein
VNISVSSDLEEWLVEGGLELVEAGCGKMRIQLVGYQVTLHQQII